MQRSYLFRFLTHEVFSHGYFFDYFIIGEADSQVVKALAFEPRPCSFNT